MPFSKLKRSAGEVDVDALPKVDAATETGEPAGKDDSERQPPAKKAKQDTPAKQAKKVKQVDEATPSDPKPSRPKAGEKLPRSKTPRVPPPPEGSQSLKILSVNVAGLRAVLRGDKAKVLSALIEREAPDVFCINEHKLKEEDVAECEKQLKELLPKEYVAMHWSCCTVKKGYSGVAVFLRESSVLVPSAAIVSEGMGVANEGDSIIAKEGRVLTIELPDLFIVSVYVPNSGADLLRLPYRVNRDAAQCWDRDFGKYVSGMAKPVVVIGDLNCAHRVQDIWNMYVRPDFPDGLAQKPCSDQYVGLKSLAKSAGTTPEERESFPTLLADAKLIDTFRALHPNASGVFSYFSQRVVQNRPLNRGLRLDYALASASLCSHLKSIEEGAAEVSGESLPVPRIHDSFILDEDDMIGDHSAIGCTVILPPR